jgi:hypothetical protein
MPQARRALAVMTIAHDIQHFCVAVLAVTYPFAVAQFHISSTVLGCDFSQPGCSAASCRLSPGCCAGPAPAP